MTEQHLITPSPELIEEWIKLSRPQKDRSPNPNVFATYAARWGYQQHEKMLLDAMQALENADGSDHPVVVTVLNADQHALIRRALESLSD